MLIVIIFYFIAFNLTIEQTQYETPNRHQSVNSNKKHKRHTSAARLRFILFCLHYWMRQPTDGDQSENNCNWTTQLYRVWRDPERMLLFL